MLEKIKSLYNHPIVRDFKDIRVIGFAVFGVLVLLVTWSGVNVIETNYQLERQVSKLEQENQVAQLKNNNDKLKNQYYQTDQYLEIQAREHFGKGLAGETLLIVPKNVALKHTVDPTVAQAAAPAPKKPVAPLYQRNLEAWRDFLFHRTLSDN